MSLKKPHHKIQSSFAGFEFTWKELNNIRDEFNWQKLALLPDATFKNKEQYHQLYEIIKISMLGYHIEVLKESLKEHLKAIKKELYTEQIEHINELIDFLTHLRNGLSHAKGKLIPLWIVNIKAMEKNKEYDRIERLKKFQIKGLTIKITSIKEGNFYRFNESSKYLKKINFKIRLNKEIFLKPNFFQKIRLLSWHILTITKKQKSSTLSKYLKHNIK